MKSFLHIVTISAILALGFVVTAASPACAQADHLQCFKVKDTAAKQLYQATLIPSDSAFPVAAGCVVKVPATVLCVDVQKTNVTPPPPGAAPGAPAQKFLCYKVKCPKAQPTATLQDQFGTHALAVKSTSLLCAPVPAPTTTTVATTSTTSTMVGCSPSPEVCGNGIDDDCDGEVDELPCSCTVATDCPPVSNGSRQCVAGQCTNTLVCNAGFEDCDAQSGNGCETSLQTTSNCGACSNQCSNTGGVAGCTGGVCTITCNAGRADCDGDVMNGCEVNMQTDVFHCGSCFSVCGSANGTPSCTGGVCAITCNPGWADCDGNPINGCEENTQISHSNCGGCGLVCPPATPTCVAGACQ